MTIPSPQLEHSASDRDRRFNFGAFLSDMVSFAAASALLSSVTILPLFASHLTKRAEVIALIPTLNTLGVTLPQIIGAHFVAHRTNYRPFVMRWVVLERAAVLGAVISLIVLARAAPMVLFSVPLGFISLWWVCMGVNSPAYTAMLERAIPAVRRGRLFGVGTAVGGFVGLVFAAMAGRFLEKLVFPYGFAACAFVAFLVLSMGAAPLGWVREAPVVASPDGTTVRGRPLAMLRTDPQFRRYLTSQVVFAIQSMPMAIWTTYALARFHAGSADIAWITAVMAASGGVGALASGWLADHCGNRAVLLAATLLSGVAALSACAAPTMAWYIAAFIPIGIALSAWALSSFNILMEFAPSGQVPRYSAAAALVAGPPRVVAPLLGGALYQAAGGGPVFIVAAAACVAAAGVILTVHEPRGRPSDPAAV